MSLACHLDPFTGRRAFQPRSLATAAVPASRGCTVGTTLAAGQADRHHPQRVRFRWAGWTVRMGPVVAGLIRLDYCLAMAMWSRSSASMKWSASSASSPRSICTQFTSPVNSLPRGP
jgi:hypothetical protein